MDIFQFATEADNYDDLEPWSQGGGRINRLAL